MRGMADSCRDYLYPRKALVVAAAVLAAGGGLAYFRTGQRRPHRDSSPALNGNGTNKSSGVIASAAKDQSQMNKRKQGGIKNVKFLAGILLNHIGKGGLNEFLALATISVSSSISTSVYRRTLFTVTNKSIGVVHIVLTPILFWREF